MMETYGLLTVLGREDARPNYLICRCRCGVTKSVRKDHLRSGKTISCGCEHKRRSLARVGALHRANTRHGKSKSPIYGVWCGMRRRCENPKNPAYPAYGGRGITVCDRWKDFAAFLADMGEPPEAGFEIERIDNDRGYEPGNCRWATRTEQQNNRRNSRFVEWNGKRQTVAQWSRETGLHINTISGRLDKGWPLDKVFAKGKLLNLNGLALGLAARRAKGQSANL